MFVNHMRPKALAVRSLMLCALAVLALLVGGVGTAFSGSDERIGTNGAHELRLPVGPRGTSLGGTVVGDVEGVESIFWNPAGLSSLEGTEALFSNTSYFADQKLNFIAIGTKAGDFGVLGLNVKVLSIGDVIVTTEDAPEGTGEIIEPTFTVLGFTMARQFTDRVRAGLTINYVNEHIISTSASGVAVDLGFQYLTGWRGLKLGMVMKNFGTSMKFDGENFELATRPPDSDPQAANRTFRTTSSAFEMPSYFSLAASYDLLSAPQQRVALLGLFQNNNFEGDNLTGGLEWSYRNMFAVRGSYFGSIINKVDPLTREDKGEFKSGDDLYQGYAFGAGAKLQSGGTNVGVDVAWRPVRDFFDDTVEVGLRLKF